MRQDKVRFLRRALGHRPLVEPCGGAEEGSIVYRQQIQSEAAGDKVEAEQGGEAIVSRGADQAIVAISAGDLGHSGRLAR